MREIGLHKCASSQWLNMAIELGLIFSPSPGVFFKEAISSQKCGKLMFGTRSSLLAACLLRVIIIHAGKTY